NHYYRKINVCFSSKNKTKKFKLISNDRQAIENCNSPLRKRKGNWSRNVLCNCLWDH
ncbi:unnamed protein product, partial [Porites evermanni]